MRAPSRSLRRSGRRLAPARAAFTLVEIIIALTLLSILGAAAVTFLVKQTRAVMVISGRLDAQQNVSFAIDALSHDLRVAGVGLGNRQPMMLEATPYAVTFNADLVTTDTSKVTTGTYFDPSVPESLTVALTPANKITYPLGAITYPDSTYYQSTGLLSNAETVSYYFTPDSTTAVPGEYLLLKRINNAAPTLLARGIVFPGGAPGFRYFIPGAAVNSRVELTSPTLPLYYQIGSVTPDSILAQISEIRVQLQAMYVDPVQGNVYRSANENVALLNAGLAHTQGCLSPPLAPATLTQTAAPSGDSVGISWPASGDETGGKHDVKSYSVFRQVNGSGVWNTPIYTIAAAGTATYAFQDKAVPLGPSYTYAVVARDCTPSLSGLTQGGGSVTPLP